MPCAGRAWCRARRSCCGGHCCLSSLFECAARGLHAAIGTTVHGAVVAVCASAKALASFSTRVIRMLPRLCCTPVRTPPALSWHGCASPPQHLNCFLHRRPWDEGHTARSCSCSTVRTGDGYVLGQNNHALCRGLVQGVLPPLPLLLLFAPCGGG